MIREEKLSIEAPGMREAVDVSTLRSRIKFDRTDVPFDERGILSDATETGFIHFAARYKTSGNDDCVQKAFKIEFGIRNLGT